MRPTASGSFVGRILSQSKWLLVSEPLFMLFVSNSMCCLERVYNTNNHLTYR